MNYRRGGAVYFKKVQQYLHLTHSSFPLPTSMLAKLRRWVNIAQNSAALMHQRKRGRRKRRRRVNKFESRSQDVLVSAFCVQQAASQTALSSFFLRFSKVKGFVVGGVDEIKCFKWRLQREAWIC